MRFLEYKAGKLTPTGYLLRDLPEYAILSHTWGTDEVTYRDMADGVWEHKAGAEKLWFCAKQAERDGLRYIWVDTCCIDKSDNSELSEAINSMFRWYRNATRCYAYLADVTIPHSTAQCTNLWDLAFRSSRWFTRGWTLQELLAPSSVEFFSRDGRRLGDKRSLGQQIHEITGIATPALEGAPLSGFDIEERFRWAEKRETTREEDGAYCLLGIFDVSMPLIYGEGKAKAVRRLKKEISETPPPYASIPFRRDPDFVHRGDILEQIDKQCSEPASRMALVGLGGVGKSQLAIEFAYRLAEGPAPVWVFWVHAGTRARIEEGFRTIADAVKLPGREQPEADIPQLVYNWLSQDRNGRWVMILDSADDSDVFYRGVDAPDRKPLASYLPQSQNGSILITTRSRDLARRLAGDHSMIEIGMMAEEEALLLLEKRLGTITERDAAAALVQALEYVPLAIHQAAGYIQERAPRMSLKKYLDHFREGDRKRTRLLGHDGGDLRRDGSASNAVLTTWQISFEHIDLVRRSAADLLALMSFFNRQGIPESLLKPAGPMSHITDGAESDSDSINEEINSDFEDDIAMLRDFCLITVNENGSEFEMHALVQLSTRKWLEAKGRQETFKAQYIDRLGAAFPTGKYENWATCRELFSHVEAAVDSKPRETDPEAMWAALLNRGSSFAQLQGRYDLAERMARTARKSCERLFGKEGMTTLSSTSSLAAVLLAKGQWKEAEELFRRVMETGKTKLGPDNPDTLTSMANLALTLQKQGRWEEAEKLNVQVMETRITKLGRDHPDTLSSMNNLATTYKEQCRWEEAEKLAVQVMETRKTKSGPDHPDTWASMNNLAAVFWGQARWEEAEKLEVQVIEISKTKLGPDHPNTLTSIANLASIYRDQGRWEEAEKLEVQVIEISKTKLGPDHPNTLVSMNSLATIYREQGRWEEAEKLAVQVMETRKTKFGANHPDTLLSMTDLASIYKGQSRWEEAEKLEVQVRLRSWMCR